MKANYDFIGDNIRAERQRNKLTQKQIANKLNKSEKTYIAYESGEIIPMLKEVFPIGLEIDDLRMEMYKEGNSILRQMGTCPIRVAIENTELKLDLFYKIRVIGYIGNRTILGELI